mmetsp:Transcript_21886/g.60117  ORF Transcript_21886/g.60117 Transcript_21886/m.60117 type:complete len:105 (-) Transcript_21886:260-574(-)
MNTWRSLHIHGGVNPFLFDGVFCPMAPSRVSLRCCRCRHARSGSPCANVCATEHYCMAHARLVCGALAVEGNLLTSSVASTFHAYRPLDFDLYALEGMAPRPSF